MKNRKKSKERENMRHDERKKPRRAWQIKKKQFVISRKKREQVDFK